MKKVFSWILSLALIFSLLPNQVFAASTLEFSSEKEGEKIVVTLTLPKYEKVMAAEAVVEFSDALKLESVTSGTYSPLDFEEPNVETATSKGKVTIGHSNETLGTATIEGEYAKLTFSIKDGTAPGSYDIKLTELTMSATDYTTNIAASDAATLPKTISVVVPKPPITSVSATVSQPVKGHPLDTSVNVYGATAYTAEVIWKDVEENMTATGDAKPGKIYTALITLKAKEGETFATSLNNTTTLGGYTIQMLNSTELLLTKEFDRTNLKETTGITIDNTTLTVAVPTAAPNMEQKAELPLTAKVNYDDGTDETVNVTWSILTNPKPEGVNIEADGKLTVTNKAKGGTVEVKAAYNGMIDKKTVTITKDTLTASAIVATAPTTGTNITIPNGGTETSGNCSYKVYDQYGAAMTGIGADWKMEPETVAGVMPTKDGAIAVDNRAKTGTVKLYAKSGTLESNRITFNIAREASVATTLTIEGSADSVTVPTVTEPGTTVCAYASYNATVKDQYGEAMSGQTIAWSVTDNPGVTINNGQLIVTNGADPGTVTITATSDTLNATKNVTIKKDAAKVSIVKITAQDGEPPVITIICTGSQRSESYTATVYDQYGNEKQDDVTWSLNPTDSGVDYEIPGANNNIVTLKVAPDAAEGIFKLVATSQTATTVKGELEIKVQKKNNVNGKINFNDGSLTYKGEGQEYQAAELDDSVTAGTGGKWTYIYTVNGGTASLDGGLPKTVGTYTVTATYEDSLNIGSKSATLTITHKKVDIPDPDTTVYTYDGTAKTYNIPPSPYYTVSENIKTNANEGGYIVNVTLKDSTNTIWANNTDDGKIYFFKIMKATPTGAPAYTKITAAGKTLADAALEIGTINTPGTIKWVKDDGTTELPKTTTVVKNQAYKWLFTPADTANYNTLTGSLTPYYVASSGGGYVPTVQKPEITIIGSGKADLSADGRTATITANAGHELVSVVLNGKEMGKVEKLTGLKTGDKATITFQAKADGKAEMDKMIAQKASKLKLMARSAKTAKLNIKVVVKGDLKAITDAGYTVKYKFYRSTKKSAGYKAMLTKKAPTYYNTYGKKGTMYYYKARVMIYDKEGNFVAQTALKQCKYANRLWTK